MLLTFPQAAAHRPIMSDAPSFTAFVGFRCVATGDLAAVARAVAAESPPQGTVVIFADADGRPVDLDLRDGAARAMADHLARTTPTFEPPSKPGRGRPRLGVVAREVTLLPRHWDWLAGQPGGASAALRRLVEEARRTNEGPDRSRHAQEALYRVMSALAGDAPGFEDAARALFARDDARFDAAISAWPVDVAAYLHRLARAARAARQA